MAVKRGDTHETLVEALRGQQVLVITQAAQAPAEYQLVLVKAAAAAGVEWILPNEYGSDTTNAHEQENPVHKRKVAIPQAIMQAGASYISVVTGQWYDFSTASGYFGVNMLEKKATIYDSGDVKTITTTLAQAGRAIAALLALPVSGASPCLSDWKNKHFYVKSFEITQKEMLAAAQRATGTTQADWTVDQKPAEPTVKSGMERFMKGDFFALLDIVYVSNWLEEYGGNYEVTHGTVNKVLGLPVEDLDEQTKYALEKAKKGDI